VLVQTGDTTAALGKAAAWIGHWRKVSIHRTAGAEIPSARLIRMMMAVDETATRRLICQVQRNETAAPANDDASRQACEAAIPGLEAGADTGGNTFTNVEPRDEFGRRRRR
jgi:hypothetical protein